MEPSVLQEVADPDRLTAFHWAMFLLSPAAAFVLLSRLRAWANPMSLLLTSIDSARAKYKGRFLTTVPAGRVHADGRHVWGVLIVLPDGARFEELYGSAAQDLPLETLRGFRIRLDTTAGLQVEGLRVLMLDGREGPLEFLFPARVERTLAHHLKALRDGAAPASSPAE